MELNWGKGTALVVNVLKTRDCGERIQGHLMLWSHQGLGEPRGRAWLPWDGPLCPMQLSSLAAQRLFCTHSCSTTNYEIALQCLLFTLHQEPQIQQLCHLLLQLQLQQLQQKVRMKYPSGCPLGGHIRVTHCMEPQSPDRQWCIRLPSLPLVSLGGGVAPPRAACVP